MNKQTTKSLFTDSSLKRFTELYQRLLTRSLSFKELGSRLVSVAEHARIFRTYDVVSESARLLINLPINEYQLIGKYYLAWHGLMKGSYVKPILELVAEQAPQKYRALAMHSLAAIESYSQNYEAELSWFLKSMKIHPSVEALRAVAVVKAKEGFHHSALKDLGNLTALIPHAEPLVYYDVLNSYAVELGESGRLYEARNVCKVVLASPFAFAYPEWQQTALELRQANRSFAVLKPSKVRRAKLLRMPQTRQVEPAEVDTSATVISLPDWKKKMGKDPNGKSTKDMAQDEMLYRIIHLFTAREMDRETRLEILEFTERIAAKQRTKKQDEDSDED